MSETVEKPFLKLEQFVERLLDPHDPGCRKGLPCRRSHIVSTCEENINILKEIQQETEKKIADQATLRNSVTPLARLPPEVLSMIFEFVLEHHQAVEDWMPYYRDVANLSLICSKISGVLQQPWFWTKVASYFPKTLLNRCFQKSSNHRFSAYCILEATIVHDEFVKLVSIYEHRCRSLVLNLKGSNIPDRVFATSLLSRHLPALEDITVSATPGTQQNTLIDVFYLSKRLRQVETSRVPVALDATCPTQLKSLKISGLTIRHELTLAAVLGALSSPDLMSLDIDGTTIRVPSNWRPIHRLVAGNLKSLQLKAVNRTFAAALLNVSTFPKRKTLILEAIVADDDDTNANTLADAALPVVIQLLREDEEAHLHLAVVTHRMLWKISTAKTQLQASFTIFLLSSVLCWLNRALAVRTPCVIVDLSLFSTSNQTLYEDVVDVLVKMESVHTLTTSNSFSLDSIVDPLKLPLDNSESPQWALPNLRILISPRYNSDKILTMLKNRYGLLAATRNLRGISGALPEPLQVELQHCSSYTATKLKNVMKSAAKALRSSA